MNSLIACSARLLLVAMLICSAVCDAQPRIAAASDLKFAMDEIAAAFTRDTGKSVTPVYGSSGNFRRQIAEGAPFELFMSADESYILALAKSGHAENDGVLYAIGRIVLFAPKGSTVVPDESFSSLSAELKAGKVKKFAIANPEHAPYGRAAREALTSAGLWSQLEGKLVLGENVSQAAQFATSAGIEGGIFAYSLALNATISERGRYVLLPESMHAPLRQRMALMKGASATARDFYAYLQSAPARAVFARFGFALPKA